MSSPKWTNEQQAVIGHRKGNLLVAAAAGSGKTAVLVERIIQMILDKENPIDIDKLLVVTFTNAAAAEMRERINAPLTEVGLVNLVMRNERLSKGSVKVQKLLLETALINNWKNIYPPREQEIEAAQNEIKDELRSLFGLD